MDTRNFTYLFYGLLAAWAILCAYVISLAARERKIKRELGWSPKRSFESAIAETINWYKQHQDWWRSIKSGEYLRYYEQQYAGR
jgi:hypothetical protein